MKKVIASLLSLALVTGGAMTCLAADTSYDQDSTENIGSTINCSIVNDPTYTVTIPSSISMDKNGTDVSVSASDVSDLNGQKISVTIAGTDYYRNQMVLVDPDTRKTVRYQVITPAGETLETTGDKDQMNGKEIVSFTADGTQSYHIQPVMAFNVVPGSYTGTLTYGIELADAE